MEFTKSTAGDTCNIILDGKFTFSDHEKFRSVVDEIKKGEAKSFVFDFGKVDFIDSAGLGMLLIAREESERSGSSLVLSNTGKVDKMFKIAKFDSLFKMQ